MTTPLPLEGTAADLFEQWWENRVPPSMKAVINRDAARLAYATGADDGVSWFVGHLAKNMATMIEPISLTTEEDTDG